LLPENGFHVARALVGTEGTCATVLEATLRLVPWPRHRALLVIGYDDVYAAAAAVPAVMACAPTGCEALDRRLIEDIRATGVHESYLAALPEGNAFLLVELGGDTREEAGARARDARDRLNDGGASRVRIYDDPGEAKKIWLVREAGLGVIARVPGKPDTWPGWEDSAVPPERLADYLRDLRALLDARGLDGAFYGHFGQGCLHSRITFDVATARGIANYRGFVEDAADLCARYGGSISGEHGDGQSRAELLPRMFGPELVNAFREFKAIWDPDGRMNP